MIKKGRFETPKLCFTTNHDLAEKYGNNILVFNNPHQYADYQDGFGGYCIDYLRVSPKKLYLEIQTGDKTKTVKLTSYIKRKEEIILNPSLSKKRYSSIHHVELKDPVYHGTNANIESIYKNGLKSGYNNGRI
jgi:hypothetical protein